MNADTALDVVRREALWFEPTSDGLAVLHIDQTSALEPLERWAFDEVDLPETYPSGI